MSIATRSAAGSVRSNWRTAFYSTSRNQGPPTPKAYKPSPANPAAPKPKLEEPALPITPPKKPSLLSRLSPFKPDPFLAEPRDFARGIAASQQVVRTGVLPARYRPAARKIISIICALPIALYLSWELYQRRFMGKEQKVRKFKKEAKGESQAT
ncbi:Hypothetical protein R9X50_00495000 [Acrodontium crateriforme]|uniref:Uncharacterized protein n=1 Tax=Acrodontium crateriforme TaxID=150365 RepID=A0AAQ3M688_9PEZI|nr:Hypothetical protein R9X50_00495000 [Acrodontium crateriforme]